MSDSDKPTVAAVVGRNLRRLREQKGRSQEQVAELARAWGLPWQRVTVASVERGARAVPLEELVLLASTLTVEVADLLAGDDEVQLTDTAAVTLPTLRTMLAGGVRDTPLGEVDAPLPKNMLAGIRATVAKAKALGTRYGVTVKELVDAERDAARDAERKAAHRLGVEPVELAVAARSLWGRSLVEEREARVTERTGHQDDLPARSLQTLRGHVTRELLGELAPRLQED